MCIRDSVDTSGYIFNEKVKEVLEYTDLVLLDIKAIDEKVYKDLTGVELENTLKFAQYLKEKGKKVWIRHVIVPGITDDDELLNRLAEYVSALGNVEKVELLPDVYKRQDYNNPYFDKYDKNMELELILALERALKLEEGGKN